MGKTAVDGSNDGGIKGSRCVFAKSDFSAISLAG